MLNIVKYKKKLKRGNGLEALRRALWQHMTYDSIDLFLLTYSIIIEQYLEAMRKQELCAVTAKFSEKTGSEF